MNWLVHSSANQSAAIWFTAVCKVKGVSTRPYLILFYIQLSSPNCCIIYIYIHMTTVYCTRTSVSSEVPHRHFNRKTRPVFSWSEIHKPAASPYDSTGYALWTFWRHQPHQPLRAFWQPLSFSEKTKWLVTGLAICRWEPRIGDWKGLPIAMAWATAWWSRRCENPYVRSPEKSQW